MVCDSDKMSIETILFFKSTLVKPSAIGNTWNAKEITIRNAAAKSMANYEFG